MNGRALDTALVAFPQHMLQYGISDFELAERQRQRALGRPQYRTDENLYGRVRIMHRPQSDPALQQRNAVTIEMLPMRAVADVAAEPCQSCAICYEEWKAGDVVKTLPCLHYYHQSCIDFWLQTKLQCPYCRAAVTAV